MGKALSRAGHTEMMDGGATGRTTKFLLPNDVWLRKLKVTYSIELDDKYRGTGIKLSEIIIGIFFSYF